MASLDEVARVRVPDVGDMSEEHFRLHIELRHPAMRRTFHYTYSRFRHDAAHKACPQFWFGHWHASPEGGGV